MLNSVRFGSVHLDQIKPGVTLKDNTKDDLVFEVVQDPKYRGKSLLLDINGLRPGSDTVQTFTYVCNPSVNELDIVPNPSKIDTVC